VARKGMNCKIVGTIIFLKALQAIRIQNKKVKTLRIRGSGNKYDHNEDNNRIMLLMMLIK